MYLQGPCSLRTCSLRPYCTPSENVFPHCAERDVKMYQEIDIRTCLFWFPRPVHIYNELSGDKITKEGGLELLHTAQRYIMVIFRSVNICLVSNFRFKTIKLYVGNCVLFLSSLASCRPSGASKMTFLKIFFCFGYRST